MAYIKFKEISKYFYFSKRINEKELPTYVLDYVEKDEKIIGAYKTSRDKGVFTDKKILLFDVKIGGNKQIHVIPYSSISTLAIVYKYSSAAIVGYADSGYPIDLKFINLSPEDKTELRILFCKITSSMNK